MSAKTPDTSATSYLSAANFLVRADVRTVGDLCSDNGVRVTAAALLTDANLAAALLDASGMVEQACAVAGRYRPVDLAALTGAGQAILYRLVTRLTTILLHERRPDIEMKQPWLAEFVENQLQQLRDGERIFPFVEVEQTGVATERVETFADVDRRNLATRQAEPLFGMRANRYMPSGM